MSSALFETIDAAESTGRTTVPDALMGCWRRNWIQFDADGEPESLVKVIWLQTASGMGDLRIDPRQAAHETDSSCGITVVDQTTTPYMTADWLDGDYGFAQQPVSNFPEKGWLAWDSPSIMRELAPSGAYVEQWERFPDSLGPIAHLRKPAAPTATNLYVAGDHVMLCVKHQQADGMHEFSWGYRSPATEQITISLSTIADRIGTPLQLDDTHQWHIESCARSAAPC